jgi:hypothetical protein
MSRTRNEFLQGLREAGGEFPTKDTEKGKFRYLVVHTYRRYSGTGSLSADDYTGVTLVPVASVEFKVVNRRQVECKLLSKDGKVLKDYTFSTQLADEHHVRLESSKPV